MRAALLLPALLLSGCLAEGVLVPASSSDGTFRFIEVLGEFKAERDPHLSTGVCGFPSTPEVDEANRTLVFRNDWPGRDYAVLLLTVTWDRTQCGVAATGWATSHRWGGVMEGGGISVEMREDGALLVDGREVSPGGEARVDRNGTLADGRAFSQSYVVRDRGAWPLDGVSLAG